MVSIFKYLNLRDPNTRLLVYSLLILKKVLILYFIALIFMFFVSLFTKANEVKLIEGNAEWFKSPAQKRREAQAARDHYNQLVAAMERERQRCLIPTAANWRSCGPKYYFPEKHFKQHAEQSKAKSEQIFNASKKPDRGQTSSLNGDLNRY